MSLYVRLTRQHVWANTKEHTRVSALLFVSILLPVLNIGTHCFFVTTQQPIFYFISPGIYYSDIRIIRQSSQFSAANSSVRSVIRWNLPIGQVYIWVMSRSLWHRWMERNMSIISTKLIVIDWLSFITGYDSLYMVMA